MNLKIVFAVAVAFFISFFGLFFTVYALSPNDTCILQNQFYNTDLKNESGKIFLVGSSQIGMLNNTFTNHYLIDNNQNFEVYNLASPGDKPSKRIWSVNKIISMKPELVVYGIGYRDFEKTIDIKPIFDKPSDSIFDPHEFVDRTIFIEKRIEYCTSFLESPKIVTRHMIGSLFGNERENELLTDQKMPFFKYSPKLTEIRSEYEISHFVKNDEVFRGIDFEGREYNALESFIASLKNENIKIIIITMPFHEKYLNEISDNDKENFILMLENLKNKFDIEIFYLHDKYSNLNIWRDTWHIAKNSNSLIFSKDVTQIIHEVLL